MGKEEKEETEEQTDKIREPLTEVRAKQHYIRIEYILEKVSFYSEEFFIQKGALIPRPETEILIDRAVKILKNIENPKVLEVGVGSGIISVMLAKLIPDISIIAVDISSKALEIANKNISNFGVSDNIELRESNLFKNIKRLELFDLIISNPPYISNSEKGNLQRELDYEPDVALYGGTIGDEILQNIITEFILRKDSKYLLCEMGYDQKNKIINFLRDKEVKLDFYKDLAGFDRGFTVSKS